MKEFVIIKSVFANSMTEAMIREKEFGIIVNVYRQESLTEDEYNEINSRKSQMRSVKIKDNERR